MFVIEFHRNGAKDGSTLHTTRYSPGPGWLPWPPELAAATTVRGLVLVADKVLAITPGKNVPFNCNAYHRFGDVRVRVVYRCRPDTAASDEGNTVVTRRPRRQTSPSPVYELRDADGGRLLSSAADRGRICLIGRDQHCDVRVDDPRVSLVHAAVLMSETGVHVVDLHSRNGTYLNGYRADVVLASSAATIRCGRTWFSVAQRLPSSQWVEFTSKAMQPVYRQCDLLAATNTTVLIQGETGCGKEHIARRLHDVSGRSGPFVVINSASLSSQLAGSELFGHLAGSFTGAQHTRIGAFAQAAGGTLFLDEVADLEPTVQAQLLRAVESGEYKPVGGNETERSTARLVCASHKDLLRRVADGGFRADLYHRLSGLTIYVPPLRQRPEDLDVLIELALCDLGVPRSMSRRARQRLHRCDWSGNIRELTGVVRRAAYVSSSSLIRSADVELPRTTARLTVSSESLLRKAVDRAYLERGNDTVKTARALGMRRKKVEEILDLGSPRA